MGNSRRREEALKTLSNVNVVDYHLLLTAIAEHNPHALLRAASSIKGSALEHINSSVEHFVNTMQHYGKIGNIKRHRFIFGTGLKEAKDAVEEYELRYGATYGFDNFTYPYDDAAFKEVFRALIQANKSGAIATCMRVMQFSEGRAVQYLSYIAKQYYLVF